MKIKNLLVLIILLTPGCSLGVNPVAIKNGCVDIIGVVSVCPNIQNEEIKNEEIQTEKISE